MPPEGSDLVFDHRHNAEMSESLGPRANDFADKQSAAVSPSAQVMPDINAVNLRREVAIEIIWC